MRPARPDPSIDTDEASVPLLPLPADEVLFIFKCEWDSICSFWDGDGSANRVFTVSRADLGDSPASPPVHGEDGVPPILPELGIVRWLAQDDGAPAEREDDFYNYMRHNDLPDEMAHPHDWAAEWRTKVGGVPYWTANGVQRLPPGRLLLQIDNFVTMEDGSYEEVANFCSDGTAYIFIDRTQVPPAYSMIINR